MTTKRSNSSAKKVKICVIGTWHLGSIASACLAEMGNYVCGVDFDKRIITRLEHDITPVYEPGLKELIDKNEKNGRLHYTKDFKTALNDADYIFITFDTPVNDKDQVNLKLIFRACRMIAKHSPNTKPFIVISSQVSVGTCRMLKQFIQKENPKLEPEILYNPENIRLSNAIETFIKPDRIVIGAESKSACQKLILLYHKIKCPKFVMSLESAEMVKHALNSYLATSVSFINEIANLCEATQANITDVIKSLKTDGRIGKQAFLNPGLGFGGGTLARDLQDLIQIGEKKNVETRLLKTVLDINHKRINYVIKKIRKLFPKLNGLKGGILGLTYKPGTNTLRRSISLELAKQMVKKGVRIKAFDPMVFKRIDNNFYKNHIHICKTPYEVAKGSQFLLIATECPEFKDLNYRRIYKLMQNENPNSCPVLIDVKNMLDPSILLREGFKYLGTGVVLNET